MPHSNPLPSLCLATRTAQKLGRNGGAITYQVLADAERQRLFLTLIENDGGGYFSREIVPFEAVEQCLPTDNAHPFAAKLFARCFRGKSANNPGFMAAILRSAGLLGPVEFKPHLHRLAGDWEAWKRTTLGLPGEPYAPPRPADITETDGAEASAATPSEEGPAESDTAERPAGGKGRKGRSDKATDEDRHENPA